LVSDDGNTEDERFSPDKRISIIIFSSEKIDDLYSVLPFFIFFFYSNIDKKKTLKEGEHAGGCVQFMCIGGEKRGRPVREQERKKRKKPVDTLC